MSVKDTCPIQTKCKKSALRFPEIESFMDDVSNITKLKIKIVYYNSALQETFKNSVNVKYISSDCNLLFTKLGNYYYIYNGIIANPSLIWKSSNTKARLANHITIGYDRRGWNIHETVYETNMTPKKLYYIVKKTPVKYYNINNTDQSLIPVIPGIVSKLNTESIWNEILCGCGGTISGGGKGISINSISYPYKAVPQSTSLLNNIEEVIVSIRRLLLAVDEIAVYRVVYNTSAQFKNNIIRVSNNKNVLFIHNKI